MIVGLGVAIFVELTPFFGGVLGAATIYILLRRQMRYLTEHRRWRRSTAATLLLGESVLCFLLPISLIIWLIIYKIQGVTLDARILFGPMKHLAALFHEKTGYDLLQERNVGMILDQIPRLGQWVIESLVSFGVNVIVLLFVLYFMLVGGRRMEDYVWDIIPFSRPVARGVMHEVHMIVRSNALGIPLLAIVQGLVAYLGYLVFGAPNPLFWGLMTCFATIIPIVGTALVWFPLAAFMAFTDNWGGAVGLLLYGSLVITYIDNVVRMILQKRMADTHPLVTVFGVFVGLSLFGFMGVIFGPLMIALLIFCIQFVKQQYLDGAFDARRFPPSDDDESIM